MSRKSGAKEVFLKVLLVTMVLTTILIIPQRVMFSSASPDSTEYSLSASPARIQEGLNTSITVSLQEANISTTYNFKVNVTAPDGVSYSSNVTVVSDETGVGSNLTGFWGDFVGANTDLVGTYNISLCNIAGNETLAAFNLTVGLTDKLKYVKSETVSIRGSGYAPNERVIVTLRFGGESASTFPRAINASSEGVVTSSWQIPANASLGVYSLSISNATVGGTVKTPADLQSFRVEGLCKIEVRNLSNETVAGVVVEVWNATSGLYLNLSNETDENGQVEFVLEKAGNYTFKAFWRNPLGEVGAINQTVTGNINLSLTVWLAHLKLSVTDEAANTLPLIDLNFKYNYTARGGTPVPNSDSITTNVTGSVQAVNTFANVSYLIEARRYGFLFNTTYVKSLSAGWNNLTIIAPAYTMFVQMLDSRDAPANGLQVAAYDWNSGIGQPAKPPVTTGDDGNATLSLTFGRYRLRMYNDTTFVNEVTVDLVQNPSFLVIRIDVYNINLSVLVIDYFGQPIPNVFVELQRKSNSDYATTQIKTSGSNGVALFSLIIGGESRVSVSVAGRPGETQYLYLVGSTKEVVFKMDGYVAFVGYALETSQFVTIILLLILIVAFLFASTYKRLPHLLQRRRK